MAISAALDEVIVAEFGGDFRVVHLPRWNDYAVAKRIDHEVWLVVYESDPDIDRYLTKQDCLKWAKARANEDALI